ncbi:phosphohydrolase [Marinobacter fuscus]|uniref:Phosphohydrolase n=1 Tax=Marinobacter fuscus TaxID=2109942 RepID=A0A2T1K8E0_9GAMM|nr:phosphohydrolase [Marinobacter fuscus]
MGVRQKRIAVHDLEIGMFVSDLDRPWHQTPFPIQGFYLRSEDDLKAVSSHCRWVMIDVAETREALDNEQGSVRLFHRRGADRGAGREALQLPPLSIREPVSYEARTPLKKEVKASRKLLIDAEAALARVFSAIEAGHAPDLRPAVDVTRKMVDSVARQPHALLWLSRTRQHDDFVYRHALNTAVWALVCGRQLGLNEGLLNHLGIGCLLSQVGKTALPRDLLLREHQLSAEEYESYRSYVQRGCDMLEHAGLSRAVMSVVQNHRERHNGSGFPRAIKGDRIPLLAKIAGLAEFFESMIAPRGEQQPMTPARAVTLLYDMRNIEFQEDLVEAFIQSVGVYPTGTLVALSDGRRGMVVSHAVEKRLWPSVMVMQDAACQPLKSATIIDLARHNESRAPADHLFIDQCLPHGTEGLEASRFDTTGAESRWSVTRLISR